MKELNYKPIGIIHSPFNKPKGTPIQPANGFENNGTVEVFPEYADGLKDLEGFSHIFLLYHFHLSNEPSLEVIPFMDNQPHGVFATRAPSRPNPIGISVVHLIKIVGNIIHVKNLDIIEGTPLLDIKPYVPEFDERKVEKLGWLNNNVHKLLKTKDDERFIK